MCTHDARGKEVNNDNSSFVAAVHTFEVLNQVISLLREVLPLLLTALGEMSRMVFEEMILNDIVHTFGINRDTFRLPVVVRTFQFHECDSSPLLFELVLLESPYEDRKPSRGPCIIAHDILVLEKLLSFICIMKQHL